MPRPSRYPHGNPWSKQPGDERTEQTRVILLLIGGCTFNEAQANLKSNGGYGISSPWIRLHNDLCTMIWRAPILQEHKQAAKHTVSLAISLVKSRRPVHRLHSSFGGGVVLGL
jgi:hypothetical protein